MDTSREARRYKLLSTAGILIAAALVVAACSQSSAPAAGTIAPAATTLPAAAATITEAPPIGAGTDSTGSFAPTAAVVQQGQAMAAGNVEGTKVIEFQPGGIEGAEETGNCWTASIAVNRQGVWRCAIGNAIEDPCFAIAGDDTAVICGADPTETGKGFKLKLTEPLPTEPPAPARPEDAWMLLLADGTKCSAFLGARFPVVGDIATFACGSDSVIAGDPVVGSVWTVKKVAMPADYDPDRSMELPVSEVAVKTVWR